MLGWTFGADSKKFSSSDLKYNRQLTPLSELRRDLGADWAKVLKKKADIPRECGNNNEDSSLDIVPDEEFYPLTKLGYQTIVKAKRREHVHAHFSRELEQVFDQLEDRAMHMSDCHFEVSIDINESYDIDKVEVLLQDYFIDLGFDVIIAERCEERKVILTLT